MRTAFEFDSTPGVIPRSLSAVRTIVISLPREGVVLGFPQAEIYVRAKVGVSSPRNVSWASLSLYTLYNSKLNPGVDGELLRPAI